MHRCEFQRLSATSYNWRLELCPRERSSAGHLFTTDTVKWKLELNYEPGLGAKFSVQVLPLATSGFAFTVRPSFAVFFSINGTKLSSLSSGSIDEFSPSLWNVFRWRLSDNFLKRARPSSRLTFECNIDCDGYASCVYQHLKRALGGLTISRPRLTTGPTASAAPKDGLHTIDEEQNENADGS